MKRGDYHNITETVTILSIAPETIVEAQIVPIENYLISVYFPDSQTNMEQQSKVFSSCLILIYVLQLFLELV